MVDLSYVCLRIIEKFMFMLIYCKSSCFNLCCRCRIY